MKHCEELRIELPRYLSGDLSGGLRAGVEGHLESCEECRQELAALQETVARLQGVPLEHAPPETLERDVFDYLALEPVADLARKAPLEHAPPIDLERRALSNAGVFRPRSPTRWQRAGLVAVPALAASIAVLGWFGLQWRNDAAEMHDRFGDAVPMATVQLIGQGEGATWPTIRTELVEQFNGHYAVVLYLHDYPPNLPGEHCEVWQAASNGERVSLGAFVSEPDDPRSWKVVRQLAYAPSDYPIIEVTIEPDDDDDPDLPGRTVMQADLRTR